MSDAIKPVLQDFNGFRVCWSGITAGFTAKGRKDADDIRTAKFALQQMNDHLDQIAKAYYGGECTPELIDNFLQLYCAGEDARKTLKAAQNG